MSKANVKFANNDEGVSPIIATLVLIVVAIVGAAAVGLIMGSFSSNVSKQANSNNAAGGASTQIIMGGSTTIQPLAALIAPAYMDNNTGVKITVQAGGSGAGEIGTGMGTLDIGMASEYVPSNVAAKYPNIQTYTIGGSAVVIITGSSITPVVSGIPRADLLSTYTTGTGVNTLSQATATHVYTRDASSGSADALGTYLWGSSSKSNIYVSTTNGLVGKTGNEGMLAAVQADPIGVGYVDYGFVPSGSGATGGAAATAGGVNVQDIQSTTYLKSDGSYASVSGAPVTFHPSSKNNLAGLKDFFNGLATPATAGGATGAYDILVRPLNLLTNGAPNTIEQSIISFFGQPQNEWAFTKCGYYSMYDIGV